MESFKALCEEMLADTAFKEVFEEECNICTCTMRIFAKLHAENIDRGELLETLGVDPEAVCLLEEAECCDPRLVKRLCRHLGLPIPANCPKMDPVRGP